MSSTLDFFLSKRPKLKAKGDWPGNLGLFILVNSSDKNKPVASIRYSSFLSSANKILDDDTIASLILASEALDIGLFSSKKNDVFGT